MACCSERKESMPQSDLWTREMPQLIRIKCPVKKIFSLMEEAGDASGEAITAASRRKSAAVRRKNAEKEKNSFHKMAWRALYDFFMYLSASDGFYSLKEAEAMEDILGERMTPWKMEGYVNHCCIYTEKFENREPAILRVLTDLELSFATRFIDLMEKAGQAFLLYDGNVNAEEKKDLETYISMMRHFTESAGEKGEEHG